MVKFGAGKEDSLDCSAGGNELPSPCPPPERITRIHTYSFAHIDRSLAHIDRSLAHIDHSLAHIDRSLAHIDRSFAHIDHSLAHIDHSLSHTVQSLAHIDHSLAHIDSLRYINKYDINSKYFKESLMVQNRQK